MSSSPRSQFLSGLRAVLPMIPGMIPFAMISGVVAVETGLLPSLAMATSVLIFAGASQLAALQLIVQDAPLAIIVLTALIINLRFTMYSASLAPYLHDLSMKRKSLAAYLPLNLGLLVAAGSGILIGLLVEQRQQDRAVS